MNRPGRRRLPRRARSFLYVPGNRPHMLDKAPGRGADAIIADLEDGVPEHDKQEARRAVESWLATRPSGGPAAWVRVNPGPLLEADLRAIVSPALSGIVLPKVASADDVGRASEVIGDVEEARGLARGSIVIGALIETAAGIVDVEAIAGSERVSHLAIGETDLAADLGMHPSPDGRELDPVRLSVVVASAAARLNPPVGPVQTDLEDLELLLATSRRLRRLGYGGRAVIHPRQVPIVNAAFSPTEEEIAEAQEVLARFEAALASGRAITTGDDGSLIDEAVARRARATLATAETDEEVGGS